MPKIDKMIQIDAPVEKVFSYLQSARNLVEIWPSLVEVSDVRPSPLGGENFSWVYKMAGMRFEGTSEKLVYTENERCIDQSQGGIEAVFTWDFKEQDQGTLVSLSVDYHIPIPLVGRLADVAIKRANAREADRLLENLKAKLEVQPEPTA